MGQSLVLNGFTSFTKDSCDFVDPQCVAVKFTALETRLRQLNPQMDLV